MATSIADPQHNSPEDSLDRSRVRIVLVRARNPSNIGAVARAMHDFGFHDLHLVSTYPVPFEAARSAIDASAVLQSATHSTSLPDALTGCTLVLGTTAVGERAMQHPLWSLANAAPLVLAAAAAASSAQPQGRVALLFGSEKTGLSNEELSHCHALLTIPMHTHAGLRHASMNLGQAVAVCLWELVRPGPPPKALAHQPAASEDLDRLFTLLYTVLEDTQYTRRHAAAADAEHIRRLLHRLSLEAKDVAAWLGIFRQILWRLNHPAPREPMPENPD